MVAPIAGTPARRLWIYTNFDCNLQCRYCVARSGPRVERRLLAPAAFRRVVDEAVATDVRELFVTGGEPFLLPDITDRLNYAVERLPTTVLTNAMLFSGGRLEQLRRVSRAVRVQVSLDGAEAETHDAYRGSGSWERTLSGISTLQALGFSVLIGSTETTANRDHLGQLATFVAALGIPPERHFVRPLAKRGYSQEGLELGAADLEPELTISRDGVYWHPLALDGDLLLTRRIFPLAAAWELLACRWQAVLATGALPRPFK